MRRTGNSRPAGTFERTLAAARAGEGWAMRALYESVVDRVASYARGQGAEDPDALANETLYRSLSRVGEFAGDEAGFRSWVFTIAHNLIIDDRRRQVRRPQSVDDGTVVDLASPVDGPETVALSNCSAEELVAAVHELTDSQRDVLLLRVIADLSLDEVATLTGRPVGAVKALQHRGLASLRRRLAVSEPSNAAFTNTP